MAVDAWNMAAECARAIDASKDPTRRALVGTLQKLWIELGNKERLLSEQHVLKEMEDLYALHEVFLGTNIPTTGHWARERSLMLAGSDLPRTAQDSGLRETDREAR
jgi:hypothetical protein